ncbi:hypothetical protein [Desulfonatronum parangueonense]
MSILAGDMGRKAVDEAARKVARDAADSTCRESGRALTRSISADAKQGGQGPDLTGRGIARTSLG